MLRNGNKPVLVDSCIKRQLTKAFGLFDCYLPVHDFPSPTKPSMHSHA